MPTTTDPADAVPLTRSNQKTPQEAASRPQAAASRLTTVETTAAGTLAVTRPGMPRIFRFLLALTGVKV
jgi:hypothetical protein